MRIWTTRLGVLLGIALFIGLIAACGGGSSTSSSSSSSAGGAAASSITVTEAEWSLKASSATAAAGNVTFVASNKGTTAHELLVVQTDLAPDKLPQANGAVDEKQVTVIGRTANIDAGKSETKALDLKPGKYVLLCNLPAHYGQGMHIALTVQ